MEVKDSEILEILFILDIAPKNSFFREFQFPVHYQKLQYQIEGCFKPV